MKIGVIGAGIMGYNHARVLKTLPNVAFIGLVEPDEAQAKKVKEHLPCTIFATLEEFLAQKPEAAIVAAPTFLHYEIALKLIEAGVHLLVEKPIASTVFEGQEVVDKARAKGVTLSVGHVERFNPAVLSIKKAIENEEILSVQITRVGPFPPRMSNVGVVIDLAVHDIDLIRWFTDSEIVEVQPQISKNISDIREDFALLQFKTANGVLAHINTNWLTPFKARTVTIATKNKYVIGDLITRQVTEYFDYKQDGSYAMRHLPVSYDEPLKSELMSFIEAVQKGTTPQVTGEQGVAALAVAIQCLEGVK
jgi:UDP-N-acetylglucosamine 3-dehydrogenase